METSVRLTNTAMKHRNTSTPGRKPRYYKRWFVYAGVSAEGFGRQERDASGVYNYILVGFGGVG